MGALQYVSTSALSLTLSGNTGVGPFLTLFIVGIIEKSDPELLAMEGWVEKVVASWPAIAVFGVLTVLEFVGKCVPVVDAAMESAMTFVVPIFSILGSMSSWGLFTSSRGGDAPNYAMLLDEDDGHDHGRRLSGETGGFLIFLQVCLCLVGIVLALLVHLCMLLIRLMGEGCCTCCITFLEYGWILVSVTLCVFIVPIAIGAACCLMVAAGFGFKNWWEKRQKKKGEAAGVAKASETGAGGTSDPSGQRPHNGDGKVSKGGDNVEEGGQKAKEGLGEASAVAVPVPSLNPEYVGEATAAESAEEILKDDIHQPLLP